MCNFVRWRQYPETNYPLFPPSPNLKEHGDEIHPVLLVLVLLVLGGDNELVCSLSPALIPSESFIRSAQVVHYVTYTHKQNLLAMGAAPGDPNFLM